MIFSWGRSSNTSSSSSKLFTVGAADGDTPRLFASLACVTACTSDVSWAPLPSYAYTARKQPKHQLPFEMKDHNVKAHMQVG